MVASVQVTAQVINPTLEGDLLLQVSEVTLYCGAAWMPNGLTPFPKSLAK